MRPMIAGALMAAFVAFGATSVAAWADTPSTDADKKQAIHDLLQLTHATRNAKAAAHAMAKRVAAMEMKRFDFSEDQKNLLLESVNDYMDQHLIDNGQLERIVTGIYAEHFTRDDIRQMASFYQTPTGQKVVRLMPTMSREIISQIVSATQSQQDELKQYIRARFEQAGYSMRDPSSN